MIILFHECVDYFLNEITFSKCQLWRELIITNTEETSTVVESSDLQLTLEESELRKLKKAIRTFFTNSLKNHCLFSELCPTTDFYFSTYFQRLLANCFQFLSKFIQVKIIPTNVMTCDKKSFTSRS